MERQLVITRYDRSNISNYSRTEFNIMKMIILIIYKIYIN